MRAAIAALMLALLALNAAAQTSSSSDRLAVPNSTAQTRIRNSIRQQYKSQFASKTASEQLALCNTLRQQADTADDPVEKYVLWREARELAVNAGDLDVAFAVIDDTAKVFDVNARELRVTVLVDSLDRALIDPPSLMDRYLKVANDSLENGDVEMAKQAMVLANKIARGSRSAVLIQRAKQTDLKVHDATRELNAVIAAAHKLESNPDDPKDNLLVGRYLCFVKGAWDEGLPFLSRGADAHLKDLATRDSEGPNDATAMADLADAYWELPDSPTTPRRHARQRAVYWYEKALPQLNDPRKAQVQERIEQSKAK